MDAVGTITSHLGELLEDRGMTMTELAERVGITLANMSILKNGHARAIRFSTLAAICRTLDCQPGDVLGWQPASQPGTDGRSRASRG
jgi:putative transcriptional regulator